MSNAELFQRVKAMELPVGKYALFGSAPMGVRNLKDCRDADVIVTADLWEKYRNDPAWRGQTSASGNEGLANGDIELWRSWKPWFPDVETLIAEAELIDGLPFVRLERVLAWKKQYGREKDLKDVEIIEKFLRTI
jgi:hypothetical protein